MPRSDSQSRNLGSGGAAAGMPRTRCVDGRGVFDCWFWVGLLSAASARGTIDGPASFLIRTVPYPNKPKTNSSFSKDGPAATAGPHDGNLSQLGPTQPAQYPSSHPSTASFHASKKPVLLPVQDCKSWKRDDQYWLLPAVMAACRCVLVCVLFVFSVLCWGVLCLSGTGMKGLPRPLGWSRLTALHISLSLFVFIWNSDELAHDSPAGVNHHHPEQEESSGGGDGGGSSSSDTTNSLLAHALSVHGDLEAGKVWMEVGCGRCDRRMHAAPLLISDTYPPLTNPPPPHTPKNKIKAIDARYARDPDLDQHHHRASPVTTPADPAPGGTGMRTLAWMWINGCVNVCVCNESSPTCFISCAK